jgi:hypothetical protein
MKSGYCQLVFWLIAEKSSWSNNWHICNDLLTDISKILRELKNEKNDHCLCSEIYYNVSTFLPKEVNGTKISK